MLDALLARPRTSRGAAGPERSRDGGHRLDDAAHFRDRGGRESAELRVRANRGLVLGQVDAERLVVDNVRPLPLCLPGERRQRFVRLRRDIPALLLIQGADARDLALDDVPPHGSASVFTWLVWTVRPILAWQHHGGSWHY